MVLHDSKTTKIAYLVRYEGNVNVETHLDLPPNLFQLFIFIWGSRHLVEFGPCWLGSPNSGLI